MLTVFAIPAEIERETDWKHRTEEFYHACRRNSDHKQLQARCGQLETKVKRCLYDIEVWTSWQAKNKTSKWTHKKFNRQLLEHSPDCKDESKLKSADIQPWSNPSESEPDILLGCANRVHLMKSLYKQKNLRDFICWFFTWPIEKSICLLIRYSLCPSRFFTVSSLGCPIQFFTFQNLPKTVNESRHFFTFFFPH